MAGMRILIYVLHTRGLVQESRAAGAEDGGQVSRLGSTARVLQKKELYPTGPRELLAILDKEE